MPTFDANTLPSTTGIDLGATTQRWDLFAQTIDCSGANDSATLLLTNQSTAPGTPATGKVHFYTKTSDKRLYYKDDAGTEVGPVSGIGTVTSVALATPSEFSVSGSPVTSSGTLTFAKVNQSANLVYSGPGSGAAAAPSFRSLVADDIPQIPVSKLNSGTSATAFTFWRGDGTWDKPFDPTTTWRFYDDFINGITTNGNIGETGWVLVLTGSGSVTQIAGTSGRPGQIRLTTGTVAEDKTGISTGSSFLGNQGSLSTAFSIKPGTDTTTVTHRAGLLTGAGLGDPASGIYFRSTNGGNWFAVTRAASVETATDTTVAFASLYKRFETVTNAAGTSVDFKIDGVTRATHTTNIPVVIIVPVIDVHTTGASARNVEIDYYYLRVTGLSR